MISTVYFLFPTFTFFQSVHICYEVDFCQLSVSMQWYEVCCHKLSWFIVLSTLYFFIIIIAYNLYFAYFLRIFSFTFFKDLFINLFIHQPLLFLLKKTLTYFKEIFQCCKYDPWWFVIACCTKPPPFPCWMSWLRTLLTSLCENFNQTTNATLINRRNSNSKRYNEVQSFFFLFLPFFQWMRYIYKNVFSNVEEGGECFFQPSFFFLSFHYCWIGFQLK